MSGLPEFLRTKKAARALASQTVVAPLATDADLPTTVLKVNALLAALEAAGITKGS